MLQHFIKISLRNLLRYKLYSLNIILGYSLAFTFCSLIVIFLIHERNADRFNSKYDRISRLLMSNIFGEMSISSFPETVGYLRSNYPEIETASFVKWPGRVNLNFNDKHFIEEKGLLTDTSFLKIFDYKVIAGNRDNCLSKPNSIVLTKSFAEKYFENELPLGNIIYWKEQALEVTAVLEDVPSNSHLDFDFLMSLSTLPSTEEVSLSTATYLLSMGNSSLEALENKINVNRKKLVNVAIDFKFKLQPLKEAYFHKDFIYGYFGNIFRSRSQAILKSFAIIGLIILLVTNFNFISFSQANAIYRAKEVMINRLFGITSMQSLYQFVLEALLILVMAYFISLFLAIALLPALNRLTDSGITFTYLSNPRIWINTLLIVIVCSLLLGFINYLMSRKVNSIGLVNRVKVGMRMSKFIQGLAVVQLSVSIILSTLMFIMLGQVSFIKNYKMGYANENVLEIFLEDLPTNSNPQTFKDEILRSTNIISASVCTGNPISGRGFYNEKLIGSDVSVSTLSGDADFISTLNFTMLQGRGFNPKLFFDTMSVVVNERAAKTFNLKIDSLFGPLRVIGIVRDFHYGSFHEVIDPVLIYYNPYRKFYKSSLNLLIRSKGIDQKVLSQIKDKWVSLYGNLPFRYRFLDQEVGELHQEDFREVYLLSLCAFASIIIATFGLSGLGYFITRKKLKEVAIRKIHGATSSGIVLTFLKQVIFAVLIGAFAAFPIANYFVDEWLSNFVYRISESILYFLGAVACCFVVSWCSVLYPIKNVAKSNPINAIHNE